jgi:hypothetical protein
MRRAFLIPLTVASRCSPPADMVSGHIPGYTGYVPKVRVEDRYLETTYGRATAEVLTTEKNPGRVPFRGDPAALMKRKPDEPSKIVSPGYTGHIPYLKHDLGLGTSKGKASEVVRKQRIESQAGYAAQLVHEENTRSTRPQSAVSWKGVSSASGSPALNGYTGCIPRSYYHFGKHSGAVLRDSLVEQEQLNGPRTHRSPPNWGDKRRDATPAKEGIPDYTGRVSGYTGFTPGERYYIGETKGHTTRELLARVDTHRSTIMSPRSTQSAHLPQHNTEYTQRYVEKRPAWILKSSIAQKEVLDKPKQVIGLTNNFKPTSP